jgi:hypothetical protein
MQRLLPLVALLLAACLTVPPPVAGPTAGLGQYALVDGLRIRPIRVVEDSRCPVNVQCVWAGRLVVETEIGGRAPYQLRRLELGKPEAVAVAGGTLTLVAAEPARLAGAEIPREAYRFTFQRGP